MYLYSKETKNRDFFIQQKYKYQLILNTMKKVIFTTITILLIGWAGHTKAQNCEAIVEPYLTLHGYTAETYPEDKAEYRCLFSQASFFLTKDLPHGVTVFMITELTDLITGQKVTNDLTVDLNTFSYYRYNFFDFQRQDFDRTIYFQIGQGRDRVFLGVRCYNEAWRRATYPEEFTK